ncbi:non-homologous end-joining DNA ligase [Glycomyces sp. NRRL B-16210]|uniref:non-homologous end-joining DNA ligase n=1 Tax=Glycomyces sp. NRRL B-16210 TaxID=1463821 RepID=UPI00068C7DD1|nr:non-homologous end-joining DNA ligase [Glycomyces sp. NRRL B-16210]
MASQTIGVGGHDIEVSRLGKELFPGDGLTKGDLIEHYRAVADAMVPHLAGRPLTMRRFPDGIGADGFFQKDASDHFPDWIPTVEVALRGGGAVRHVLADEPAVLVYLANQATVEFHVWLSTVADLERPDRLVIDIDPPGGTEAATLHGVARRLRECCEAIGLTAFVQATGGRGYHVVAPLDRSEDFDAVRELAAGIAERLAADDPDLLTTAQRKERRGDRIFLDTGRNAYGQTFIAPYSLRARPGAAVATPLDWGELGRSTPGGHTAATIRRRLAQKADPWAGIDEHAAAAGPARERLDALGN